MVYNNGSSIFFIFKILYEQIYCFKKRFRKYQRFEYRGIRRKYPPYEKIEIC